MRARVCTVGVTLAWLVSIGSAAAHEPTPATPLPDGEPLASSERGSERAAARARPPADYRVTVMGSAFSLLSFNYLGGLFGGRVGLAVAPSPWFRSSRLGLYSFGGMARPDGDRSAGAAGAGLSWSWGAPHTRSIVGGSVDTGLVTMFAESATRDRSTGMASSMSAGSMRRGVAGHARASLVLSVPLAGAVRPFFAPSIGLLTPPSGSRAFGVDDVQVALDLGLAWGAI